MARSATQQYDEGTQAAVDHMLQGEGSSRCGTYIVTVRGGSIVGIAPVGQKIVTERLAQQHVQPQQPQRRKRVRSVPISSCKTDNKEDDQS